MELYNQFCNSSFLAFRYVTKKDYMWKDGVKPKLPELKKEEVYGVKTSEDVIQIFNDTINVDVTTGILLSAGIDSAILASYLPKGAKAYTIRFISEGAIDEATGASQFADSLSLDHTVVDVTWNDYLKYSNILMKNKKSPLHAIEVALYKAALKAKDDGVEKLLIGNGADSTFGGMDKLLSKEWTFDEFQERYTFVEPSLVLKDPIEIRDIYKPFQKETHFFDVQSFLKEIHGLGIIQTFNNAIETADCRTIAPYESLFLEAPLDLRRIRNGESKYILRDVFKKKFPSFPIPEKIPFARPMDNWLANWEGPSRSEFLDEIDISKFSGEQKWIIYCLEKFMNLFEK